MSKCVQSATARYLESVRAVTIDDRPISIDGAHKRAEGKEVVGEWVAAEGQPSSKPNPDLGTSFYAQ